MVSCSGYEYFLKIAKALYFNFQIAKNLRFIPNCVAARGDATGGQPHSKRLK